MNATYRVKQKRSPRLSKMSVVILSFALILLTSQYGLVNADAKANAEAQDPPNNAEYTEEYEYGTYDGEYGADYNENLYGDYENGEEEGDYNGESGDGSDLSEDAREEDVEQDGGGEDAQSSAVSGAQNRYDDCSGVQCPELDCPTRPYIPQGECCPICPGGSGGSGSSYSSRGSSGGYNPIYSPSLTKFKHLRVGKKDLRLILSLTCKLKSDLWDREDLQVWVVLLDLKVSWVLKEKLEIQV